MRRLQDAALLAETDHSRCPLDLDFPKALGGDLKPRSGAGSAAGTSVGKAKAGSPLLAVGGASYRCEYEGGGKPVTLVVVAVPEGQQTAAAVGALSTPLQDAGLDQAAASGLVDMAKGAKPGRAVLELFSAAGPDAVVAAPKGSASAATANLPGGGAASVAVVATQGGFSSGALTGAAKKLAATLQG